jgi:uncharacterized protein (TIGR00730 family)
MMTAKIVRPVDSNFEGGDSPQETVAREAWRMLGIMSEFVDATERLANIRPAVSIFGSARVARDHSYYALSEKMARLLSDAGFAVLSGGGPGLMEAVNKGAFEGRSPAVGLNIELPREQFGNAYQDVSLSFRHFFARKTTFIRFSCAYVVMPGGFGTLDELTEALVIIQTGKSMRFPVILVGKSFWQGLLAWFEDRLVGEGMISPEDMQLMDVVDEAEEVVDVIFNHYRNRSFAPSPSERESFLKL